MWVFKQLFDKVEATKPLASRMESAEIFVVCAGYKAPKHIDPRMFNAQHVFSDVGVEKIMQADGTMATPKSRVPEGYQHHSVMHRTASLSDFLATDDPKGFLKQYHEITFPEADRKYLASRWSKKELVYLCQDLIQVGEADKRRLIRWRDQLLREQRKAEDQVAVLDEDEDDDADLEGSEHDDDAEMMAMEYMKIQKHKAKELKKKQKKLVDRKLKQVQGLINHNPWEQSEMAGERTETNQLGEVDGGDYDDEGIDSGWHLTKIAGVADEDIADRFDEHWEEAEKGGDPDLKPVDTLHIDDEGNFGSSSDDSSSDEEGAQPVYDGALTGACDVDHYGNLVPFSDKKRSAFFGDPDQVEEGGSELEEEDDEQGAEVGRGTHEDAAQTEKKDKTAKWQLRHKNIDKIMTKTFPKPKDGRKRSRHLEEDIVEMEAPDVPSDEGMNSDDMDSEFSDQFNSDNDNEEAHPMDAVRRPGGFKFTKEKKGIVMPDVGQLTTTELVKAQRKELTKKNKQGKKNDAAFEEIPIAMTDPEIRARTLAIATEMLDSRKRRDMLEAGINKYSNNDDDDLPDWFVKDEQMHCTVNLPVTSAMIEAQRQRFQEMNSRPGKKVMEAMQRKRRRATKVLRGLIEKGKTDPRARDKAAGMSVRKLMRSRTVKEGRGGSGGTKKKKGPQDNKSQGEKKRERQKMKRTMGKKSGKRR